VRQAPTVPSSWRPGRRHGPWHGLIQAAVDLARAYRRWRERERAVAELASLDDTMLADLGFHRSEIRSAVIDAEGPGGPRLRRRAR